MLRRAGVILVLGSFLAATSGPALTLHLHDGGHAPGDHGRSCDLCAKLSHGPAAVLPEQAALITFEGAPVSPVAPPRQTLPRFADHSPVAPRAPPRS